MRLNIYSGCLFILIIILSNVSYSSHLSATSGQSNPYKGDYKITFDLSGDFIIIGTAKLFISGSLSIDAVHDSESNFWYYTIKYTASIPNAIMKGNTLIMENDTNKNLVYQNIESGIIGIIWNTFSNNSQNDVYSIFRITPTEIQNKEFQLLNYSATIINNFNLFSPKLSKSLKTHKITFQTSEEQKLNFFFDIIHLRLVGFDVKLSENLNGTRYLFSVNAVVSEVNYSLAKAKLEIVFIFINFLISGSILIIIIMMIRSKYSSSDKISISGGLSNDK